MAVNVGTLLTEVFPRIVVSFHNYAFTSRRFMQLVRPTSIIDRPTLNQYFAIVKPMYRNIPPLRSRIRFSGGISRNVNKEACMEIETRQLKLLLHNHVLGMLCTQYK